jgi:hypothetical protein
MRKISTLSQSTLYFLKKYKPGELFPLAMVELAAFQSPRTPFFISFKIDPDSCLFKFNFNTKRHHIFIFDHKLFQVSTKLRDFSSGGLLLLLILPQKSTKIIAVQRLPTISDRPIVNFDSSKVGIVW